MSFYIDGEGVNGNYYSPDFEYDGEYDSEPYHKYFVPDHLYYHKNLFLSYEKPIIEQQTEKAYLFKVDDKLFWVPIALLKNTHKELIYWKVHQKFSRQYI